MQPGDLTILSAVKTWLGLPPSTTSEDALISALISSASVKVQTILGRGPLAVSTYSEIHDVVGNKNWIILHEWPVLSVASVEYLNNKITVSALEGGVWPPQTGYLLEATYNRPQRLTVYGYNLWTQKNAVRVTYDAGYQVTDPPVQVPQPVGVDPPLLPTQQTWIGDIGVTYADGTPLTTALLQTNPLSKGQYYVTPPSSSEGAVYNFSPQDIGEFVILTYSSPPAAIERCVIELSAMEYRHKDRIGIVSQTLVQQGTVVYTDGDIAKHMQELYGSLLLPYRRVAPI